MVNTYEDNPAKGLSKLQKAILVWLYEMTQHYAESAPYMHGNVPWRGRPSFYGRPLNLFGGRQRFWHGERQAVSRALRRLADRRLVLRRPLAIHPGDPTRTRSVCLTIRGRDVARTLVESIETAVYKDRRPKALQWLYMVARGDSPCSACGEPIDKDGHCDTEGCVNASVNRFDLPTEGRSTDDV